ncbi:helix-turn-helix transcriptional regulator [Microbispora sp. H10836]|uniref:helix-turn-helix domain-containing protein n=1 Tax=Microbispora sp. H10836 TaxID=2729106 RepID=UPI002015E838|nr:helix-turn-helix transcriptional regulator [Microbispora sp. H10836]
MTETLVSARIRERVQQRRDLPPPSTCRALRQAAGLRIADVAEAVGVTTQAVSYWELGRRTPRGRYREAYLEALNALREVAA